MRACCEFFEYLLVTAMHTVKDTNGQPGILQIGFFKRSVMSHIDINIPSAVSGAGMITLVSFAFTDTLLSPGDETAYSLLYSDVKNTFFGCQAGLPSSPSTASISATSSPCVLTPRTRFPMTVSSAALTRCP